MPALKSLLIVLHPSTRKKLRSLARRTNDARYRTRCLIVLRLSNRVSVNGCARQLECSPSTVRRVRDRWLELGLAGLVDRREDNGNAKADAGYVDVVRWVLQSTPGDFNHRRPTWTKRLLIRVVAGYTGVTVSPTTMGRTLATIGARQGRAKPVGPCPWSESRRRQRMNLIRGLIDSLPPDQACVWEHEADVDLNPKIGVDWTLPGEQRRVMTPGKNVKRYFAAAMDATSDRVTWVRSDRERSTLFIALLKKLLVTYADRKVIHVVLDNYTIHTSKQTREWVQEHGEKFRFHFLPPYSPDDNRIERKVWREMHANVTVNHRCRTIEELCREVSAWLMAFNRNLAGERESRAAIQPPGLVHLAAGPTTLHDLTFSSSALRVRRTGQPAPVVECLALRAAEARFRFRFVFG
jgi:transposase